MTGQIPDEVTYRRRRYEITAVDGKGLFDPEAHGLEIVPVSTALWRGHLCRYTVHRQQLTLAYLEIGDSARNAAAVIDGVAPRRADDRSAWEKDLAFDLALPVAFTGRLLLGRDYVHIGWLHMGFTPAWLFADVQELVFTEGRLTSAYDRSAELAAVRDRLGPAGLRPAPGRASSEWIHDSFSLSFAYSWPGEGAPPLG